MIINSNTFYTHFLCLVTRFIPRGIKKIKINRCGSCIFLYVSLLLLLNSSYMSSGYTRTSHGDSFWRRTHSEGFLQDLCQYHQIQFSLKYTQIYAKLYYHGLLLRESFFPLLLILLTRLNHLTIFFFIIIVIT